MPHSRYSWLFLAGFLILHSCGQGDSSSGSTGSAASAEEPLLEAASAQKMDSLPASLPSNWIPPVQLTGVKTTLQLDSLFSAPIRLDSLTASPGIRAELSPDKRELICTIEGDPGFLSTLRVWAGEESCDLLLKYPVKKKVTLRLRDEGYKSAMVKGEMNNWDSQKGVMKLQNGIWECTFDLAPGDYKYRFQVDGKEMLDPKNPQQGKSNSGGTYSLLSIKQPNAGRMPQLRSTRAVDGAVEVEMSSPGAVFAFWENHLIPVRKENGKITIPIPEEAAALEQSNIRVYGQNETGTSNELVIPLRNGAVATGSADPNSRN